MPFADILHEELDMRSQYRFAISAFALAAMACGAALAGADDYVFEPVHVDVKRDDPVVAVRLIHKPSGKPVPDAIIIRTRIDMAPDNMADMESPLTPVQSTEPGAYAFRTELTMSGRWLLSIAAKVQGEPETVIGKVTFRASR
jgi:hypothetical protein